LNATDTIGPPDSADLENGTGTIPAFESCLNCFPIRLLPWEARQMPKRHEHIAQGTFPLSELERLRKRAMNSLTDCEDFTTPQRQRVNLVRQAGLPRLDDLSGIAPFLFWAEGYLPARGNELSVLTDFLKQGRKKLRGANLYVRCQDVDGNWVGAESNASGAAMEACLPALLRDLDASGREPILNRVIEAARLPVVLVRNSFMNLEQIRPKHAAGGSASTTYSDQHGALSLWCATREDTAVEQMERVRAVMEELVLEPEAYIWRMLVTGDSGHCLRLYTALRGLPLPVCLFRLDLALTLTELAGVEALRRLAGLAARKQFVTTLCRFPLPTGSTSARKKLGKVLIRTSKEGHRVSLFCPSPDVKLLSSLGDKLGLDFGN
jgi:hypothetical protein